MEGLLKDKEFNLAIVSGERYDVRMPMILHDGRNALEGKT